MSIENQIPKIIIGLILVTFSFAIAGFLIDLMYIVIYLVLNVFTNPAVASGVNFGDLNAANIQGKNVIEVASNLGGGAGRVGGIGSGIFGIANTMALAVKDMMGQLLNIKVKFETQGINFLNPFGNLAIWNPQHNFSPFDILIDLISLGAGSRIFLNIAHMEVIKTGIPGVDALITGGQLAGKITAASAAGLAIYTGAETALRFLIPYLVVFLILLFVMLFALFRLWFQLLLAYISILIDVVFAPFWILAGLFPGSPVSFGAWLRDIIANLSAFPITILMFLLGKVFIESFKETASGKQFVPPLIGNPASTEVIGALIGLGVILLTPQVVAMMKDALKAPQFKYTAAIGQAVGVGAGVFPGAVGQTSQFGSLLYGLSHVPGIKNLPIIKSVVPQKQ
jgi:hypothetical protein